MYIFSNTYATMVRKFQKVLEDLLEGYIIHLIFYFHDML